MRRLGAMVDPALGLVLAASFVLCCAWALLTPPWQSPDENWHFAYAQSVAERAALPGSASRLSYSLEQRLASERSYAEQQPFRTYVRPPWLPSSERSWRVANAALPHGSRSDGGGVNFASQNPPGYYALEALPYRAASSGSIFDRLYLMRIFSGLLLLVAVAATWQLAGELLGGNRLLQTLAAAVVGLQPMATFVSASVNPDGALIAAWAVALALGVRIIRRGLTLRRGVGLAAVCAAAVLVKATGYFLLPPVLLALGLGIRRWPADARRRLVVAAACAAAFVVPVGAWLTAAWLSDRPLVNQVSEAHAAATSKGASATSQGGIAGRAAAGDRPSDGGLLHEAGDFANYLWQFYLPRMPFQAPSQVSVKYGYDTWVRTFWAAFGWKEVRLETPLYRPLAAGMVLALVLGLIALTRGRLRAGGTVLAFLALTAVSLVGALHVVEFRYLETGNGLFLQGRYALPLLPLLAVAVGAAMTVLPARVRPPLVGLTLAWLVAFQVLCLGASLERYYA